MQDPQIQIKDLGELTGDVLVFGGPYSNFQASQALINIAENADITATNRICTGDIVAYCGNPVETLHLWQGQCELVAGNCEKQIGAGAVDCGCGFVDGSACDLLAKDWYPYACGALSIQDRKYLAAASDIVVFNHHKKRFAAIHGGVSNVARFLWPSSPAAGFLEEIELIQRAVGSVDCVIAGHCGIPFKNKFGGTAWLNAGAIGMPAHDGSRDTFYAVISESGSQIERLSYDNLGAQKAMEIAGLTSGYQKTLVSGYWPSEDILPADRRRQSFLASG